MFNAFQFSGTGARQALAGIALTSLLALTSCGSRDAPVTGATPAAPADTPIVNHAIPAISN